MRIKCIQFHSWAVELEGSCFRCFSLSKWRCIVNCAHNKSQQFGILDNFVRISSAREMRLKIVQLGVQLEIDANGGERRMDMDTVSFPTTSPPPSYRDWFRVSHNNKIGIYIHKAQCVILSMQFKTIRICSHYINFVLFQWKYLVNLDYFSFSKD